MALHIRPLTTDDAAAFREIRLEALKAHPEAFAATYDNEAIIDEAGWRSKLSRRRYFGAVNDGKLVGMIGYARRTGEKEAHNADIVSMYVRPEYRGQHVGEALINQVVDIAKHEVLQLLLCCTTTNKHAYALYQRMQFRTYGTQPRALKVGDTFYDEHQMVRDMKS